ncbi:MAG: cell division inhibitor [Bacteroidetes bacterium]|nr:MAG: cell division inhibitor [Bacteroidota bacterium]
MIHHLHYKTHLNIDINTAWDFFSDPKNLNTITPPDMHFKILSGADKKMYPGQIIIYKISPFPGITTTWVTEITHVVNNKMFVDEQRFGPYEFWHHQHWFEETKKGILMEDIVHYKIPLGWMGDIINAIIIKHRLKQIFDYRQEKLNEMFNKH